VTKSPAARIAALAAFVRKLLLIAATLIAGAELVNPDAVHDMHPPSLAEKRTHHAAREKAVRGALPAVCWELFPMFGKPTIGNNQQR